jgi:hypothetical protein
VAFHSEVSSSDTDNGLGGGLFPSGGFLQSSLAQQSTPGGPPQLPNISITREASRKTSQESKRRELSGRSKCRVGTFPEKLHKMLTDLESVEGGREIASFLQDNTEEHLRFANKTNSSRKSCQITFE